MLSLSLSGIFGTSVALAASCTDVIDPTTGTATYHSVLTNFFYTGGKTYAMAAPGASYFTLDANISREYLFGGADTSSMKKKIAGGRYGAARPVTINSEALKNTILKYYGATLMSSYINAWREYGAVGFTTIDGAAALTYSNWLVERVGTTPAAVMMDKDGKWTAVTSGPSTTQVVEFDGKLDCALDLDALSSVPMSSGGGGGEIGPGQTTNSSDPNAVENVMCAQDLNLNGLVGESGEILNCLNTPQGNFCPVGALDCNTSFQAPTCPSGSVLETTRDMCQKAPDQANCPDGYTLDQSIAKCTKSPPCPEGGTYNTITDRCEKLVQNDCPTGYSWEEATLVCQAAVVCSGGASLNASRDRCEKPAAMGCPAGFVYSSSLALCQAAPSCPAASYNSVTNQCEVAASYSCGSGYTYNVSRVRCEKTPVCPDGMSYSSTYNVCIQSITPSCGSGYTYNASRVRCEKTPVCPDGTIFNSATNRCESGPACASGSYSSATDNCASGGWYAATCTYPTTTQTQTFTPPRGIFGNPLSTYDDMRQANWMCAYLATGGSYTEIRSVTGVVADGYTCDAPYWQEYPPPIYVGGCDYSHNGSWGTGDCRGQDGDFCGGAAVLSITCTATGESTLQQCTCPSGGVLSGNTCSITSYSAATCPATTSLDSSADKCVANPTCSGGTFDGSNDVCYAAYTPSCPQGSYDSSSGYCTTPATCSNGAIDGTIDVCYSAVATTCPDGYAASGGTCIASVGCSSGSLNTGRDMCEVAAAASCDGYSWDADNAICYSAPVCDSGVYNVSRVRCEATVVRNCGTYTWNQEDYKCLLDVVCPTSGSFATSLATDIDQCLSSPDYVCGTGLTWNGLPVMKCEAVPICAGAIYYDPVANSCLQAVGCPYGDQYACKQNPGAVSADGQGGWQCSANECAAVTGAGAAEETGTPMNEAFLQDDGPRDESGNCLGQIYIFSGKPSRCRPPGLQVGMINNCCAGGAAITEDTGASPMGLMVTSIKPMYDMIRAGMIAYEGFKLGASVFPLIASVQEGLAIAHGVVEPLVAAGKMTVEEGYAFMNAAYQAIEGVPATTAVVSGMASMAASIFVAGATYAAGVIAKELGGDHDAQMLASAGATVGTAAAINALVVGPALIATPLIVVGVVIIVVMRILMGGGCDQNDIMTANFEASKRCHHVGDYCDTKFLGMCTQKAKGYCCFNSQLARIIAQQGRPQLSTFGASGGWGPANQPECRGFSPEEFQALDFGHIDLSEYYTVLQRDMAGKIDAAQQNVNRTIQQRFQQMQGN